MAKDNVQIVWEGLKEFSEELGKMDKLLEKNLFAAMKEYLKLVEEGAKALSPRDEGDLEDSIQFTNPKMEGFKVVSEGGSNLDYALRRHEQPYSSGTWSKYDNGALIEGYYTDGRGQRTWSKGSWRGEQPGRKYLERAIQLTEDDFEKIMARALEKTLGGK
ncbi:HK97 gp10 family phage protein [Oceanobacillus locisalsi]|uniref:HK97 gp10 family phage protein n=1 Tax=Oceanobacillus locisalsi TaxID=546107 RepID=A0ABW3NID6_9BACI